MYMCLVCVLGWRDGGWRVTSFFSIICFIGLVCYKHTFHVSKNIYLKLQLCVYIGRKLRRGDPFTEQMTDWNPPDQRERRKKKSGAIETVPASDFCSVPC